MHLYPIYIPVEVPYNRVMIIYKLYNTKGQTSNLFLNIKLVSKVRRLLDPVVRIIMRQPAAILSRSVHIMVALEDSPANAMAAHMGADQHSRALSCGRDCPKAFGVLEAGSNRANWQNPESRAMRLEFTYTRPSCVATCRLCSSVGVRALPGTGHGRVEAHCGTALQSPWSFFWHFPHFHGNLWI